MTEDISLTERFKQLEAKQGEIERLVKEGKLKKGKLPFKAFISNRRARKGWISILRLLSNGAAYFTRAQIDENIVEIDGQLHVVDPRYIISYKKKPLIILPEWSMYPLSLKEHYERTEADGLKAMGTRHVYNYMKRNLVKEKKKFGFGVILLVLMVIGGIVWYMYKQGMLT